MTIKKYKLLLGIVCISVIALLVACGKKSVTEPKITGTHEMGNPPPTDFVKEYYDEITEIRFQEMFGPYESYNRFYIDATITDGKINYTYYKNFPTGAEETGTSLEKPISGTQWNKMKELLLKHQVGLWENQYAYLNLFYRNQPSDYKENRNAEFRIQGRVFNVTNPYRYLGIDEHEKEYRSSYEGSILIALGENSGGGGPYKDYGIPPGYNQFAEEFWDNVIEYTGGTDWREELDAAGMKNMWLTYPYLQPDETAKPHIRYFSLLECYGGKDDPVPVLFVYDGGNPSFEYECLRDQKMYTIDEEGQPALYISELKKLTADSKINGSSFAYVQDGDPGVDMLDRLLASYGVAEWGSKDSDAGTAYVEQGEFYNVKNAEQVSDKNEKHLREGYDALIHLVYSHGVRKEIRLENGKLPEKYNQFRTEFWNYFIPYVYQKEYHDIKGLYEKGSDGGKQYPRYNVYYINDYMENEYISKYRQVEEMGWNAYLEQEDWRNHIDEWGNGYLMVNYPTDAPE